MWLNILWVSFVFEVPKLCCRILVLKAHGWLLTWVLACFVFCSYRAAGDPTEGTGKPNSRTMLVLTQRRKQTSDQITQALQEPRAVTDVRKRAREANVLGFEENVDNLTKTPCFSSNTEGLLIVA